MCQDAPRCGNNNKSTSIQLLKAVLEEYGRNHSGRGRGDLISRLSCNNFFHKSGGRCLLMHGHLGRGRFYSLGVINRVDLSIFLYNKNAAETSSNSLLFVNLSTDTRLTGSHLCMFVCFFFFNNSYFCFICFFVFVFFAITPSLMSRRDQHRGEFRESRTQSDNEGRCPFSTTKP